MTGTLVLSSIYQWWAKVDEAPLGSREVRGLLIARGVGGFFGGKWGNNSRKRSVMTDHEQYTAFTVSVKLSFSVSDTGPNRFKTRSSICRYPMLPSSPF